MCKRSCSHGCAQVFAMSAAAMPFWPELTGLDGIGILNLAGASASRPFAAAAISPVEAVFSRRHHRVNGNRRLTIRGASSRPAQEGRADRRDADGRPGSTCARHPRRVDEARLHERVPDEPLHRPRQEESGVPAGVPDDLGFAAVLPEAGDLLARVHEPVGDPGIPRPTSPNALQER
jgi:hypothetical protein